MLISIGYGSLYRLHGCYGLELVDTGGEDFLASFGIQTVFWYLLLKNLWFIPGNSIILYFPLDLIN